jgi:hypothetical protein
MEHLKHGINEFESNNKIKKIRDLHRGITEFKKNYQPRTNLVKDEKVIYLQILIKSLIGGKLLLSAIECAGRG